ARPRVDHVERVGRLEVRRDLVAQRVEALRCERLVDLAPPDALLRALLLDEELILRRAPGERARVDRERAALGELAVAAGERMRVEQRGRRISIGRRGR